MCYSIINYALSKLELSGLLGVRYVEAFFVFLCCVHMLLSIKTRQPLVSQLLLMFSLFCIPSLFAFHQYSLSFHNLTTLFIPYLSFQLGSNISKLNGIQTINKFIIFLLAIIVVFLIVARQYAINPAELIIQRDYTFAIVALFPFLFLIKNQTLKIILQILAFIVVLISGKRSLILGMGVALLLHYIFSIYWNKKYGFGTKISLTLLIAVVCMGVFNYLEKAQEINDVLERFVNLSEDGGSGRDYIYDSILNSINASSTSQLLFGHGYNAVTLRIFGHPAHNDILELIYDHGYVATLIWFIIVILIGYRAIRLIIMGDVEIGGIMVAIWVMWLMIFITNCIYVNTLISATFYLFFGLFYQQTIK